MNAFVRLTETELRMAGVAAIDRRLRNWARGGRDTARADPGTIWQMEMTGCIGELVYAKARGVFPLIGTADPDRDGDDGRLQYRATARPDGPLIVRPKDSRSAPYLLVAGCGPDFWLPGWMFGQDARQREWWQAPNGRPGAWFVPQTYLRPLEELTEWGGTE
jgi:hypothetical protein